MKTLVSTLTLLLFFASNGLSQSLYSVRPDSSGSFFSEDFGLESSDEEAENTTDSADESLELRMRYPELYGGNLAAGGDAGDEADETASGVDDSLETQARYPELYLDNRLYDEDAMLTIERGEQ
jgi:hypothetical protein